MKKHSYEKGEKREQRRVAFNMEKGGLKSSISGKERDIIGKVQKRIESSRKQEDAHREEEKQNSQERTEMGKFQDQMVEIKLKESHDYCVLRNSRGVKEIKNSGIKDISKSKSPPQSKRRDNFKSAPRHNQSSQLSQSMNALAQTSQATFFDRQVDKILPAQYSNSKKSPSNQILRIEYESLNIDVDKFLKPDPTPKSQDSQKEDFDFIASCVQVVTEETDHTSNPVSARYVEFPIRSPLISQKLVSSHFLFTNAHLQMLTSLNLPTKNRVSPKNEESSPYIVDLEAIDSDARSTLMIRNIPNKCTQDVLLELFSRNHRKKFDFFYLPIDYKNHCNVGYAFLNFIHAKFIKDFYREFHGKRWAEFNSQKICKIFYAKIQGTASSLNISNLPNFYT